MQLFLAFLKSGFSTLIILLLIIVVLDFGEELFGGKTSYTIQNLSLEQIVRYRTITSTLLYILRPVVILLELLIVAPSQRVRIPCIVLAAVNAVVYFPALFGSKAAFWIPFSFAPKLNCIQSSVCIFVL